MARGQNSPRGLFVKKLIAIPNASGHGIIFEAYHATTPLLTGDSGGLNVAGTLNVSGNEFNVNGSAVKITVNSTGYKLGSRYISTNSTGNSAT